MKQISFLLVFFYALHAFGSVVAPSAYTGKGSSSPLTTKGDLYTYGSADCRLGVGSDNKILVADSSQACGLRWAAAGSGTGNITDINTDATASQVFAVGTSGTDFAIADNGTGTHTFNLPSASATARGAVSTGTQTFAGTKTITVASATSATANSSSTGVVRLGQGDVIGWRDSGNSANYTIGAEGSSLERFSFNNAALFTRSFNGTLRQIITNSNAGASASSKSTLTTDAGDFDFFADSTANGANAGITVGAGFTAGFQLYNAAGPMNLRTASGNVFVASASDNSATFASTTDSTSSTTGGVIVSGGLGVAKNLVVASGKKILSGTAHLEPLEYDAGNSSTAQTIDWTNGSVQKSTLTGNVTYTFSNPTSGMTYVILQYTGAGSFTSTWPATVHWSSTTPTTTATASKVDMVTCQAAASGTYFCNVIQGYTP